MTKKSSDTVNNEIAEKMEHNEVPAIEVKGEGQHGIMYCTPSMHKDGHRYEILGTKKIAVFDEVDDVVKGICDKYELGTGKKDNKISMKVLMDNETKVVAGHNRHEAIMRYAESMLRKYPRMEEQIFKDIIMLKNERMCKPPLAESEIEIQIKCAVDFIERQLREEYESMKNAKLTFGSTEFWNIVDEYKRNVHSNGRLVIKCMDCKKDMYELDPFDNTHNGHKVTIK